MIQRLTFVSILQRTIISRLNQPSIKTDRHLNTDHLRSGLKQRTIRGGMTTTASQSIRLVISLISTAIAARLLTPKDYGLVAMVTVITGFMSVFTSMGLSTATIQRKEITNEEVSTLFWLNTAVGIVLTIINIVLSPLIAWFYSEARLTAVTLALSAVFLMTSLRVQHQALLNRQMRFTELAGIDLVSVLIGSLVLTLSAWRGYSYWSIVAMHITIAMTATVGTWIACPWLPSRPLALREVRSLLRFGGNLTGFNIVNYFTRNLDSILIGRFNGPQPLGLYDKAYSLLMLPLTQITGPISAVALPALCRVATDPDHLRQSYIRMTSIVCLLTMPLSAFVIGTADVIISLILGPQWHRSAAIFAWLGVAALVQPISGTTGWLFVAQNRSGEQFRWGLLGGTLAMISIVAGLPWGPVGVASCYSVSGALVRTPLLFWMVGRTGSVKTADLYRLAFPFLCAAVGVLSTILFLRSVLPELSAIKTIVLNGSVALCVCPLILMIMPRGRRTLVDLIRSIKDFR
jgi:PST family polysaccharide transporter